MQIETLKVGFLETNCYILTIDDSCLVIDPGDEYEKIMQTIGNKEIIGTLITHRHFDHIGAIRYFENIYDFHNLKEGTNHLGAFTFEVIYTPGHTNDSISFYFPNDKVMFVGDFIFKDAIGRTDLGGNDIEIKKSLTKMLNYNNQIIIYPGHGDSSLLGKEIHKWV